MGKTRVLFSKAESANCIKRAKGQFRFKMAILCKGHRATITTNNFLTQNLLDCKSSIHCLFSGHWQKLLPPLMLQCYVQQALYSAKLGIIFKRIPFISHQCAGQSNTLFSFFHCTPLLIVRAIQPYRELTVNNVLYVHLQPKNDTKCVWKRLSVHCKDNTI